ncbi:hypothetical protein H5410_022777 [Solanum commersonii]|uniref:Integrase core domain containing protein n=1 Tax=Solanum commersonii TaxID=4109 RepID=A0A9J5ZI42_SOLCO|nr:hypothetical protein H5410_022777 [Solanum commersonii]
MAKDDNISTASESLGTDLIATTQTSFTNIHLPSPNLAHQLPAKLTSSNFSLWKTQFLPMVRWCSLGHHIDSSAVISDQVLTGDQPNPAYHVWLRQDQLVLSWIVASVSEGILPQLVGAETTHKEWSKLVAAYASGSKPQIRELKIQLHTLRRDNASIETSVQHAKGIADKLAALQHPVTDDDLVEFIVAGLGPTYRPFTRSLESCQEDISFDALYGLLLNEERQSKRDEALNVIAPTTQFTHTSVATNRGRGRGRGNRGRGRSSNHGYFQMAQNNGYQYNTPSSNMKSSVTDASPIVCHNCEGKGHIARDAMVPKTSTNATNDPLTLQLPVTSPTIPSPPPVFPTSQPHSPSSQVCFPPTTPTITSGTPQPLPTHSSVNEISPCVDLSKCDLPVGASGCIPSQLPSTPARRMVARSQTGSLKSQQPFSMSAIAPSFEEPTCYAQAIKTKHWRSAMAEEYNALIQNGTWQAFLHHRHKISLVVAGYLKHY